MTVGDWIQLASVLVALGLGLYGVFRDRGQEREIADLRRREQAQQVAFWRARDQMSNPQVAYLVVRNGSSQPVTGVSVYDDAMGFRVVGSGFPSVLQAGEEHQGPVTLKDAMAGEQVRLEFVDMNGVRWVRMLDGKLVVRSDER